MGKTGLRINKIPVRAPEIVIQSEHKKKSHIPYEKYDDNIPI